MCGIAGIIHNNPNEISIQKLKLMTDSLIHRGPDGEGHWISDEGTTGLGHRRLCIIDLSDAASQPMHYAHRYTLIFNGEIYNYVELKNDLIKKGYTFKTHSDTEVLLALYDAEKENCLQLLDGMFAFAIYDNKEHTIFCARDRFGEKPFFYYYEPGVCFYFASEIKALWAAGIPKFTNAKLLYNYLAFGYMQNPLQKEETFYSNIKKLPPSCFLTLNTSDIKIAVKKYWSIEYSNPNTLLNFEDAEEKFRSLLNISVLKRLRSDVPLGSSLSGGLDSSIIVSIINDLNKNSPFPQNTFSAKFPGFEKDESAFIDIMVKDINANGHDTFPDEENFIASIDKIFYHQEEPYGSSSIFAQWEVMKLAKEKNVTVLLDGQGADEILAGYHNYFLPYFQELFVSDRTMYRQQWQAYQQLHSKTINRDARFYAGIYCKPLLNKAGWLRERKEGKFKSTFAKEFYNHNRHNSITKNITGKSGLNYALKASLDNIELLLRYADRNSMAHSREVRLPFLSHELVEFMFTLPSNYKIFNGWTKYIARKAYQNQLPAQITWRKEKVGYEPPQKKWMQNKLLIEKIMANKQSLVKEKVLDKKVLDQPVAGNSPSERGNNSWSYLMAGMLLKNATLQ